MLNPSSLTSLLLIKKKCSSVAAKVFLEINYLVSLDDLDDRIMTQQAVFLWLLDHHSKKCILTTISSFNGH